MRIAVLFDGAGLARLGLEQAGHECTGFELSPDKHRLGLHIGSGNTKIANALRVDLSNYDAVWASPPCQELSRSNNYGDKDRLLLEWCLSISTRFLWVENVKSTTSNSLSPRDDWGTLWNAAQFTIEPLQSRNRIIGGRHPKPFVYRNHYWSDPMVCPCITASEYKGGKYDGRRASRWYGRRLTLKEAAYHQGLIIPNEWYPTPKYWTRAQWEYNLYEAIGNGVPVYVARAFGKALKELE
jgi:site-specific DNA-cytosine methylase